MNIKERKAVVLAMEILARNINDEEVFESWLSCGVADGDVNYEHAVIAVGDVAEEMIDEWYIEDDNFRDLMDTFLRCMRRATKSGGLYCDKITTELG